ncbi:MAG: FtsX-like permease family protein, partial [Acidobacteriota bacterium]
HLLTQLLTESGVLFLAAAVLAVPATTALLALLERSLPVVPVVLNLGLGITPRVVAYAFGVSAACALAFGLAPARHALGGDLAPLLGGHAATTDQRRLWLRHALVVTQVALSLMLVVTAGLFVRTLRQAARIDPGFATADITLANLDLSLSGYHGAQATGLVQRLEERLAGLSGVAAVAAARMIPLQGSGFGLGRVRVPGLDAGVEHDVVPADWNVVTPSYFDTVRMPLVAGRAFGAGDGAATARVAVVNETFARTAWPGRPAVGQHFLQQDRGDIEVPVEVVGVVADAKYRYLSDPPRAFVFVPFAQQPVGDVTFFLKHAPDRDPSGELRAAVAQVDPSVPVMFVQSFAQAVAIGLAPQRLTAWLAGAVGIVGAGLAALGLYGLMAFLVTQRTREIGIRIALGASARDVRQMVARQGARLALVGIALGTVLSAGLATALRGLLEGVGVADPWSYAATTLLFSAVLAAACWAPAARAAATEPARTLRAE